MGASLMASGAAPASGVVAVAKAQAPSRTLDALYVQNASNGTVRGHTLTLRGVAAQVTWFADRPARATGVLPMRSAINELFDAGESAPNAALDFAEERELKGVIALELSHPRYDARTRVLRYHVRRLSSLRRTGLQHLESRRSDARLPRRFRAAALFIDDAPLRRLPAPGSVFTIDSQLAFQDAQQAADQADVPLVLVFCAAWSGPCRTLQPDLRSEAAKRGTTMQFALADADQVPNLASDYGVTVLPTVVALRDDRVVGTRAGYQGPASLTRFLDGI